jgi:hypothetical protein
VIVYHDAKRQKHTYFRTVNAEPSSLSQYSAPQYTAAEEELLLDLFGEPGSELAAAPSSVLAQPFAQWLSGSKPFLAFAQAYRSKIRKKLRMCRDVEEARNLECELRTAYVLLQAPRFAVAYEPQTKGRGRSADLAVTFRTHTIFHIEVTRLRASQHESSHDTRGVPPMPAEGSAAGEELGELAVSSARYASRRLADLVCDKAGQLAPDTPNLLWVWNESQAVQTLDLGQTMQALKRGVEGRDPALYARYGFTKPADFLHQYLRLSALVIQTLRAPVDDLASAAPTPSALTPPVLWWANPDARHPLPSAIVTALRGVMT